MSKITTADCVAFIVANTLPKSYMADWKRTRKAKQGTDIVRTFENRNTGVCLNITEKPDGTLTGEVKGQLQVQPTVSKIDSDWDKIVQNPITVNLHRAIFPKKTDPEYQGEWASDFKYDNRDKEWTGRIIFDKAYIEDNEVSFYCGPECKGGSLEDTLDGGTDKLLRTLFVDMNPDIGAAENFHSIPIVKGVSGKETWKIIEERLVRSGAVQDENSNNDEDEGDD